jgi:hypothetical protein
MHAPPCPPLRTGGVRRWILCDCEECQSLDQSKAGMKFPHSKPKIFAPQLDWQMWTNLSY